MTVKETKLSKEDIPATFRICNLDFDSCLLRVDDNIEKLSEILADKGEAPLYDILNLIEPVIMNVCKIVEEPTRWHKNDTFCISTRFKSCHQKDVENLRNELNNIRVNDIYGILKKARNETVAHTHFSNKGYEATHKKLLNVAKYLIEHEDRLKKLISNIKSLIHNVEMSIREKEGKLLNCDIVRFIFTSRQSS